MITTEATIVCPQCGHAERETMPPDACRYVYECVGCGVKLSPLPGDCCVFCSYGDHVCPPKQTLPATGYADVRLPLSRPGSQTGVVYRGVLLAIVCAITAICAACGGSSSDAGFGRLTVLSSVEPVAQAFNGDEGHPRLVLLLSPT